MLRAYKYRLYPTAEQAEFFAKNFGCCRFVYNRTLDYMSMFWIGEQRSVSYFDAKRQLVTLKEVFPWMGEVNSQSLQYAVKQCADGFRNWWEHRASHPLPKRKDARQSFHNPQHCTVDWKHGTISIPKCKGIKAVLHRPFYGQMKDITISKESGDRYYASILVDTAIQERACDDVVSGVTSIGIDLNCGEIVCSDGRRFTNPKAMANSERRLRRQQRILSRKQPGSHNSAKQKQIVSKCHAKVRGSRHDFLHKVTHELTHDSQVRTVFIEDLNVRGMVRNRHLAKTVSDASFGEFVRQLEYKGLWCGVNIIKIDRWAPSSKTCSVCGAANRSLKLSERAWTCVCCGTRHDRDYNASINIKSFGLMALPPDRREVKPADCPPVDERRSANALRSSDRLNQEKFRGVTDAPAL
ncbi:MAG: transposase [Bacteroidales bacterium]|nr:transposase [Bacteroidales bacterium]